MNPFGPDFQQLFSVSCVYESEKFPGWYSVARNFAVELKRLNHSRPFNKQLEIKRIFQEGACIQIELSEICAEALKLIFMAQFQSTETCILCAMPGQVREVGPDDDFMPLCDSCGDDYPIVPNYIDDGKIRSMDEESEECDDDL
jgi:hypothetical protein